MEKYSQFRDKGTAIAPFFSVPTPPSSPLWAPVHIFLFVVRVPLLLGVSLLYFLFIEWIPAPSFVKKCVLWFLLAIPGVWWVDLQVDGVKRGKLSEMRDHLPHDGTVIASSFTSPLDPLYLAGIFCPLFTRSWPGTRKVEPISLFRAILLAFSHPSLAPGNPAKLVSLKELQERHPKSIICVFPECTTTNGRGILPFSPSLLTVGEKTRIYPVNLRYTPGDVTTPTPGEYLAWFWKLLSKPSHCMRVRIARSVFNTQTNGVKKAAGVGYDTNIFDSPEFRDRHVETNEEGGDEEISIREQELLDRVAEDLARLGRVKRVGLDVKDKIDFVKVWQKTKKRRG
ncbi:hypothetical protein P154DRAFT_164240 [Amniculicola lignicola CBS 123094]|uniref:Phospholipid/glycerol acyltransferase domain-containing protein n=1 Tax=Amniculicola lignicola CBS 123094 TaxID=1392246 RepID=A0A6A5WMU7_9PLEO|nr:hypothetical protein P154DRAFT_164240 [Amniculicola lignicola CBS 123094]